MDSAASGTIRYDQAFFATLAPNTAYDMITRLPGFSFDSGAAVRGFAGAAGNVLIDGDRPNSKNDDLQAILQRIPATQVDHIDVVRGGAPGVDMQGRTIIANIIRKNGGGATGVLAAGDIFNYDGRTAPQLRAEFRKKWDGGKGLELGARYGGYFDDGFGEGPRVRTDAAGNVLERADVDTRGDGQQANFTAAFETPALGGKFRIDSSLLIDHFTDRVEDVLTDPNPGFLTLTRESQSRNVGEVGLHYSRRPDSQAGAGDPVHPAVREPGLRLEQREPRRRQRISGVRHLGRDHWPGDPALPQERQAAVRGRRRGRLQLPRGRVGVQRRRRSDPASRRQRAGLRKARRGLGPGDLAAEPEVAGRGGDAGRAVDHLLDRRRGAREDPDLSQAARGGDLVAEREQPAPRAPGARGRPARFPRLRLQLGAGRGRGHGALGQSGPGAAARVGREVAYERKFWGSGVASLTLRHSEIQDATDRIPLCVLDASGDCTGELFDAPGNIGDGRETDLILDLTVPLDRIGFKNAQIKGTGTYRQSEVTDPTTGETRRISGQHPFDYELHFSHDIPRWKLNWGLDVYNRWTRTYYRFNEIDRAALKTFIVLTPSGSRSRDLASAPRSTTSASAACSRPSPSGTPSAAASRRPSSTIASSTSAHRSI